MYDETSQEADVNEYLMDLETLLFEIDSYLSRVLVDDSRLVNLQFQGSNTLVLEYCRK